MTAEARSTGKQTCTDYELEVKRVYPNAKELDNETEDLFANAYWISDGHGNDISYDCDSEHEAWQSAYEKLKSEGKI